MSATLCPKCVHCDFYQIFAQFKSMNKNISIRREKNLDSHNSCCQGINTKMITVATIMISDHWSSKRTFLLRPDGHWESNQFFHRRRWWRVVFWTLLSINKTDHHEGLSIQYINILVILYHILYISYIFLTILYFHFPLEKPLATI